MCEGEVKAMTVKERVRLLLDQSAPLDLRSEAFGEVWGSALAPSEKVRIVNLLLGDAQRKIRDGAATVAGAIGDASTVELLWKLFETEKDEDIKRQALTSLAELIGPSLIPTLLNLLKHGDSIEQSEALTLLGGMEGEEIIQAFRETFKNHPDPEMRFSAALRLAGRGVSEATDFLLQHLQDESPVEPILAAFTLARLRIRPGCEHLQRLLSRPQLPEPERNIVLGVLRAKLRLFDTSDLEVLEQGRAWIAAELARE